MSKWRQKAKIDANQPEIVRQLLLIPGVTVSSNKDDIFIGRKIKGVRHNFWIEIKNPELELKKDGTPKAGAIKPSQIKLLKEWEGHYAICWTIEEILEEIGVTGR